MKVQGVDSHIVERISTLIDSGRVPHAMVLDGGTAAARVLLADKIAQSLVCTAEKGKPCGVCGPCKKAEQHIHPDIIHVTAEAGRKTISVEQIRNMREDAFVLPNESDSKVYIIDQAEQLQVYSQNALLKILEEPPAYATFILCTQSKSSLLDTVLSRTATFSLNTEMGEDTQGEVRQEAVDGAKALAEGILSHNEMRLLAAVSPYEKNYDLLPETIEEFQLILRDALVEQAGSHALLSGQNREAEQLAGQYPAERLLDMERAAGDISESIQRHANKNLTLTRLCSRLAAAAWG